MNNNRLLATTALTIFVLLMAVATTSVLASPKINSKINTIGLAVYEEPNKQIISTSINWGNVSVNTSASKTLYVNNPNSFKLTLKVTAYNWQPQESQSALSISCNKENFVIPPGKTIPVTLTLHVGPNVGALRDFNCAISFSGTQ